MAFPATAFPAMALLASALCVPYPLAAQDRARLGGAIKLGDADLYPSLRLDYLVNDNVLLTPDDELEGTSVVVSPTFVLIADRRLLNLSARYDGNFSRASESQIEFADHRLRIDGSARFDKRRLLSGFATFTRSHQTYGTDLTRGRGDAFDEPVEFDDLRVGGAFRYGVPDARGNLEGGVLAVRRSYSNLDAVTATDFDFTSVRPYGIFSYRLSGDTRAFVELRYAAYTADSETLDRDETALFGGLEFSATGALRGTGRLGVVEASYEAPDIDETTLLSIEVELEYRPVDFAAFFLNVDRELDNAELRQSGADEQAITDSATLIWQHVWSSRISHEATLRASRTSVDCPDESVNRFEAAYELNYTVRRWLEFGARIDGGTRRADECAGVAEEGLLDYDRRIAGVHVRMTL